MAEREGFEPPVLLSEYTRSPGVPNQPLWHLSAGENGVKVAGRFAEGKATLHPLFTAQEPINDADQYTVQQKYVQIGERP